MCDSRQLKGRHLVRLLGELGQLRNNASCMKAARYLGIVIPIAIYT